MTVLVDTSFLFALTNRNDTSHDACVRVAQSLRTRLVVPITVLPEIAYLLDVRLGHQVMQQFVEQITRPAWSLEGVYQADLQRAGAILKQYHDNRLDFVDSTIIALAERINIRRILTLDRRHFSVVRPQHCDAFELLPH
ncbi:MAG: PIN domain-containing protein [Anaerolineae bacterium]|nr:PIN domain-containing protein [Anaerolineae bacterium]